MIDVAGFYRMSSDALKRRSHIYGPEGRGFESLMAYQKETAETIEKSRLRRFFLCPKIGPFFEKTVITERNERYNRVKSCQDPMAVFCFLLFEADAAIDLNWIGQ